MCSDPAYQYVHGAVVTVGIHRLHLWLHPHHVNVQYCLHINGIPEYDGLGYQPQSAQLLLLPVLVAFFDLAFLPVTNGSGDSMSAFSPVKLGQNAVTVE